MRAAIIDLDQINLKKFNAVTPDYYDLALAASVLNVICWLALVCLPFIQVRGQIIIIACNKWRL